MRYLSIFSGIEAASVAAQPLGWEPIAFAEIDPFPSAVLAERFPEVPNLGDVTQIDWGEVVRRFGRPDVLVGGSPCQSFSVAGNRESLAGESRLMFEYIRAVTELQPRWFLWENVPGCLHTKDNAFSQLLTEMERGGYKDLAWRVLDAQFCRVPLRDDSGAIVGWFGPVAQRRRRVFLVGHLGEGFRSAAVLFEPESVRGDNPSSREKRKELARAAGRGPACEGGCLTPWDAQSKRLFDKDSCWPTLYSAEKSGQQSVAVAMQTEHTKGNDSGFNEEDVSDTLSRANDHAVAFAQNTRNEVRLQGGDGTVVGALGASGSAKGQGVPFVMATGQANAEVTEDMTPTLNCAHEQPIVVSGASTQYGDEVAGTLTARADSSPCADRGQNVVCMADDNAKAAIDDDMCGTLKVGGAPPLVAAVTDKSKGAPIGEEVSFTLATSQDQTFFDGTGTGYVVRRLTPVECERLQGFPDDWTLISWKGKPAEECPDGPRYKCIGNSMATNVIRLIGERIEEVEALSTSNEGNHDGHTT